MGEVKRTSEKQIWFTVEQHHKIKVLSAKENISMKAFVMKAVEEFNGE